LQLAPALPGIRIMRIEMIEDLRLDSALHDQDIQPNSS
jgi:hypothetical protein